MPKPQIFIIDDSRVQLLMLEKTLHKAGFSVHTFSNGHNLLEMLDYSHPDLIISDIDMPAMNGFELIEEVRQKVGDTLFPCFLISSQGGTAVQNRAHAVGADVFMKKPFNYDVFIDVTQKLVNSVRI